MSWLQPTDKNLLFSRNDKEDPRLGECVKLFQDQDFNTLQTSEHDVAILGYPDDEGIALNGGRIGAQAAPKTIRTFLYKMTPHLECLRLPRILDLGDLEGKNESLGDRHQKGRELVKHLCKKEIPWISFGGGHDYGYSDSCGFLDVFAKDAVVINFDAHLDVRPSTLGFNSGTPFFRMLNEFSGAVDFAEVGIQNQCNSKSHAKWAVSKGASLISIDQINEQSLANALRNFMLHKERKKVFLSIDIDAFSSNEAPGCSQSWTTGLHAKDFFMSLSWLIQNFDVRGMGIYEVSPPLDQDNRTSKLAALIAHSFIFSHLKKVK